MEQRNIENSSDIINLSIEELLERFEHYINGTIVIDPQNDNDMAVFIELLYTIERLSEEQNINLSEKTVECLSQMKIDNKTLATVLVAHIDNQFNKCERVSRLDVNIIWLCASILNFQNIYTPLIKEKTLLHKLFMSAQTAGGQAINKLTDFLNNNDASPIGKLVDLLNEAFKKMMDELSSDVVKILYDGRFVSSKVSLLLMCSIKINASQKCIDAYLKNAIFGGHVTNVKLLLKNSKINPEKFADTMKTLNHYVDVEALMVLCTDGRILTSSLLVMQMFIMAITCCHPKLLIQCLKHPGFDKSIFSQSIAIKENGRAHKLKGLMKTLDIMMEAKSYQYKCSSPVKIMTWLFEHKEVVQLKTFKEWINWADKYGLRDELSPLILCACDKFNHLIQPNLSKLFFGEINIGNPLDKELPKELKGEIISKFYHVSMQ